MNKVKQYKKAGWTITALTLVMDGHKQAWRWVSPDTNICLTVLGCHRKSPTIPDKLPPLAVMNQTIQSAGTSSRILQGSTVTAVRAFNLPGELGNCYHVTDKRGSTSLAEPDDITFNDVRFGDVFGI